MGDPDGNVINVNRVIDDGPVRPFQVFAIALCALVAFLDGEPVLPGFRLPVADVFGWLGYRAQGPDNSGAGNR